MSADVELVAVLPPDTVDIRLVGACHGCPGAASTLRDVLERELRERVGEQVVVSCENDSVAMTLGKKLLSLVVRQINHEIFHPSAAQGG